MTRKLLMGNEAFAHAALEAGVNVVAGYPGTPSSEVVETVAAQVRAGVAAGVHVEWSTNEKAALEVLCGASYAGARVLFTCKQMGLNVAADALLSVNYVGVGGGMVLFVADDPGPISSQTEQDTRRFAAFAKVPVLDPATPEQGFEMMQVAFDLSEKYHTPVIVRPTTRVCHASTYFDVAETTCARPLPVEGFVRDPKWVIFPKRSFEAHGEIVERLGKIAHDFSANPAFSRFNPQFVRFGSQLAGGGDQGSCEVVCDGEDVGANGVCVGADVGASVGARDAHEVQFIGAREVKRGDVGAGFTGAGLDADATNICSDTNANENMGATASENEAPRLGIIAGGVSAAYARDALVMLEECASTHEESFPAYKFMQVGCVYPFPEQAVSAFVRELDYVLVFEELDHVIEDELLKLAGKTHAKFNVLGKLTHHTLERGENSIDDCFARLLAFFDAYGCSDFQELDADGDEHDVLVCGTIVPANVSDAQLSCDPDTQPAGALDVQSAGEPCTLSRYIPDLPVRPPVLCPGCPHRGSFYAIKRALGIREAVYCGDIGCYTLGNAAPLNTTDTCLCMGAGITMAQGFHVAEPHKKQVAFVGDSTFFASGMTGVANAVYNQHDITIAVLDNSTTAMTGGQPHPGTGVPLMGGCAHDVVKEGANANADDTKPNAKCASSSAKEGIGEDVFHSNSGESRAIKCSSEPHPISISAVLEALGVECIVHADPLDYESARKAAQTAIDFTGPSAIIFKSPCVQLVRGGKPVTINANKCTGCKKCITEIGCPGIGFKISHNNETQTASGEVNSANNDFRTENNSHNTPQNKRGHAYINPTQCNGCGLCVQICPFDAIDGEGERTSEVASERATDSAGEAGSSRVVGDSTVGTNECANENTKKSATGKPNKRSAK